MQMMQQIGSICVINEPHYSVTAVYSAEDGGWWLHEVNGCDSRSSKKIYDSAEAAKADYAAETVEWEM